MPVRLQARTGGPRLGGHQRLIPVSARFFAEVSAYLKAERPAGPGTDIVFVVLKGPRRGMPLSAEGLDEILDGARGRARLARATCHQLRHTCLTQLRKAEMSLEAVQAQASHASIESTRIYLHLGDDWLASVPPGRRGDRRAGPGCHGPARYAVTRPALLPRWEQLEETIPARTTLPALGRIACVLRPGSVSGADLALRSFAAFLAEAEDVDEARRQLAAVG